LSESGSEPTVEELIEQIRSIELGEFLLSTAATLASLAYGKLDVGDLPEARLGIDAISALAPLLRGEIDDEARRGVEQALANLKLTYAEKVSASSSEATE
jgi:hypothetical protein